MGSNALAIPIGFVLTSAVLLLLLIGTKWRWWWKLILILAVTSWTVAMWGAIRSYQGYAATAERPKRALLMWALIKEPNPARQDPGAILLWLVPLDEEESGLNPLDYHPPKGEPRVYRMAYTRPRHTQAERGMEMLRKGKLVVLESGEGLPGDGRGQSGEGQPGSGTGVDGHGKGGGGGYDYDQDRQDFNVYEMPPAHPPAKLPE